VSAVLAVVRQREDMEEERLDYWSGEALGGHEAVDPKLDVSGCSEQVHRQPVEEEEHRYMVDTPLLEMPR